MGTEGIILHYATPVCVDHTLTLFLRAYAVLPVILISKAAAWPANDGHPDIAESLEYILSDSIFIGNLRVFSYIDAAIYAAAQVFRKMAIYFAVDLEQPMIRFNPQSTFHIVFLPFAVKLFPPQAYCMIRVAY